MAYNSSVAKGTRAETELKKLLITATGKDWQRTPKSGAMHSRYKLKGDLFIPNHTNVFLIECKHYKEDQLTSKVLVNKDPTIFGWWDKAWEQAEETGMSPMLIYKWDRSKWYIVVADDYYIQPNLRIDTGNSVGYVYSLTEFLKEDITW